MSEKIVISRISKTTLITVSSIFIIFIFTSCTRSSGSPVYSSSIITSAPLDQVPPSSRETSTPGKSQAKNSPAEITHKDIFLTPTIAPSTPTQKIILESQSLPPENWQEWPVIPIVSENARQIYKKGISLGNNPHAFSKIGDCQNVESYFLGGFDNPAKFSLGPYQDLQITIDQFSGSFNRKSAAVKGGFNVASVLSTLKSDPALCNSDETPLQCEYRLQKPSIAFISMEQWWGNRPASIYEKYLRQIVEYLIDHGVVPILVTKADNLEGDQSINAAIVRVASDYDIPLWNFWRAVQPLPHHGLWKDGFHLTFDQNYFNDPSVFDAAWPVRNLTALQTLSVVWKSVSQ